MNTSQIMTTHLTIEQHLIILATLSEVVITNPELRAEQVKLGYKLTRSFYRRDPLAYNAGVKGGDFLPIEEWEALVNQWAQPSLKEIA